MKYSGIGFGWVLVAALISWNWERLSFWDSLLLQAGGALIIGCFVMLSLAARREARFPRTIRFIRGTSLSIALIFLAPFYLGVTLPGGAIHFWAPMIPLLAMMAMGVIVRDFFATAERYPGSLTSGRSH